MNTQVAFDSAMGPNSAFAPSPQSSRTAARGRTSHLAVSGRSNASTLWIAFAALATAAVGLGMLAGTMLLARWVESPPAIAALLGVAVGATYGAGVMAMVAWLRRHE